MVCEIFLPELTEIMFRNKNPITFATRDFLHGLGKRSSKLLRTGFLYIKTNLIVGSQNVSNKNCTRSEYLSNETSHVKIG